MSLLLIHGFASGLRIPGIRDRRGKEAGFDVFAKEISDGTAHVFHWAIEEDVPAPHVINPRYYEKIYLAEQKKAYSIETRRALSDLLKKTKPSTILCHSFGCALLLNFLAHDPLPTSVRTIIFVQADLPSDAAIPLTLPRTIRLFNLFCVWDPTLLWSAIYHRKWRAGQIGLKYPRVKNINLPLKKMPNLHAQILADERLKRMIEKLAEEREF